MPAELYILFVPFIFIGVIAYLFVLLFQRIRLGKKLEAIGIQVDGTVISVSKPNPNSLLYKHIIEYTNQNGKVLRSIMYHRAELQPGSHIIVKHLPECKKFVVYTDADW